MYRYHIKILAVVAAQAQIQHLRHVSAVFSPGIYTHDEHSLDLRKTYNLLNEEQLSCTAVVCKIHCFLTGHLTSIF